MKRKIGAFIIGISLIAGLIGCGSKKDEYTQPDIIEEEKDTVDTTTATEQGDATEKGNISKLREPWM